MERYLDLLEKAYVIYGRLGFSRNLRKESPGAGATTSMTTAPERADQQLQPALALRDDVGALWENYVMVERLKHNLYTGGTPRATSGAPTTGRRSTWSRSGTDVCTRWR